MTRDARTSAALAGFVTVLTAGVVAAGAGTPAPRMAESPPAGFTGGFGEPTCVTCHLDNPVNAFGGSVSVEGLPERYQPGTAYLLTLVLQAEETAVAGFEMAVRFDGGTRTGLSAGTLRPVDGRTAVTDSAGVSYLHQTKPGSVTRDSRGSSWTVVWTAPSSGEPVAVHVAANSGSGDESPLGDLVYTVQHRLEPAR